VGYSVTVHSNDVSVIATNEWALLEQQAQRLTNIDLVVKGIVDGEWRGFIYQPGLGTYRPDQQLLPALTKAALISKVQSGGLITLIGVPPGLGTRLGIDRDLDGVLDGDTPAPSLRITPALTNTIVAWSTNASGFLLEATTSLPGTNWSPDTNVRGITGGEFNVTNGPTEIQRFFRLKEL
jgi:hypothetical protein